MDLQTGRKSLSRHAVTGWLCSAFWLFAGTSLAAETVGPGSSDPFTQEWQELAPDVWVGIRPDSPRTPVLGNTTLVVSPEGVVVFDGGAAPLASERVVQKVRELGDAPVTHIIVSHWHGDHDYGIFRILEAFPAAQVLSHPCTRHNLDKKLRGHPLAASGQLAASNPDTRHP